MAAGKNLGGAEVWVTFSHIYRTRRQLEKTLGERWVLKQSQEVLPQITFKQPVLLNTHMRMYDCTLTQEILDVSQWIQQDTNSAFSY